MERRMIAAATLLFAVSTVAQAQSSMPPVMREILDLPLKEAFRDRIEERGFHCGRVIHWEPVIERQNFRVYCLKFTYVVGVARDDWSRLTVRPQ